MTSLPAKSNSRGLAAPLRRVIAVDAGSRCLRLLWLERRFGQVRVLGHEALDLQAEGLVATEELKSHLQDTLAQWGRPPLALVLPQNAAVSQLVDLPPVPDPEARLLIEAETVKFSGEGENPVVYDFARVPAATEGRQNFWVSFCHENEIENHLSRLGLEREDFSEITTTANALFAAWCFSRRSSASAVLVHMGAQSTTVVVVRDGVAVFASNFTMGGDLLTRAIVRLREVKPEAAEALKQSADLFTGAEALAGYGEIVDGWAEELQRQLGEWRGPSSGNGRDKVDGPVIVCGAAFAQTGLLEYLGRRTGLQFEHWPEHEPPLPAAGFEIAFGAGLQALGYNPQPASLLSAPRRSAWQHRLARQRLTIANAVLLALGFVALALGIWQKLEVIQEKRALTEKAQAGLETVRANAVLQADLLASYEVMRPLFERQQTTADTLRALALLQQVRQDRNLWFVLVADQLAYFASPSGAAVTDRNGAAVPGEGEFAVRRREAPPASPARSGLIAEVCVVDEADGGRRMLSTVVNELKPAPVFARVDLLPEDLRRPLADPRVVVTNRHFALALDFASTEFQPPPALRSPRSPGASRLSLSPGSPRVGTDANGPANP